MSCKNCRDCERYEKDQNGHCDYCGCPRSSHLVLKKQKTQHKPDPTTFLGTDVIKIILSHLDLLSLVRCRRVNKTLLALTSVITSNSKLWYAVISILSLTRAGTPWPLPISASVNSVLQKKLHWGNTVQSCWSRVPPKSLRKTSLQ